MSLEDPAVLIGVLSVVLGAFSLLNSFAVAWIERRVARRSRAADLYNDYYSADNYRRVVLPVIRLGLKWSALPDDEREAYRAAVRRGWLGFEQEPQRLLAAYVSEERLHADPDRAHFRDTLSSEAYTEHESLTVFLYFWTKVCAMLDAGVVEQKMAKRLLRRPYGYTLSFIRALRSDIEDHVGDAELPVWVAATLRIERVLGYSTA